MISKHLSRLAVFAAVLALSLSVPFAPHAKGQSAKEMYEKADDFFDQENYKEAAPLFRKAAEQGYPLAQLALGSLYSKGRGVKQDYAEAAKWYRKGAEQGNAYALRSLGFSYEFGRGVKKNTPLAYALYKVSANYSHRSELAEANYFVTKIVETLTAEEIQAGEKLVREWFDRIHENEQKKKNP